MRPLGSQKKDFRMLKYNRYERPAQTMPLAVETSSAPSPVHDLAQARNLAIPTIKATRWGWLPALSLVGASGLLLVAIADALSRSGADWAEPLFWAGLLTLVAPFIVRLASIEAIRRERIGLVVLLGMMLYLVKIIHSPFGFTFSDELVHTYNTLGILQTGALFRANPILAVTPLYPGLETVAAALASLSGLNAFGAGLLVVGTARFVLTLALFLFYEQVSGSPRAAGLATLLYMANSNFLYFNAQFSYESLALPLAMLVLFAAARRESTGDKIHHLGFTLTALLVMGAVVMTHHMSSYFLTAFLLIWALAPLLFRLTTTLIARKIVPWYAGQMPRRRFFRYFADPSGWLMRQLTQVWTLLGQNGDVYARQGPGGLAVFALAASLVWLIFIASPTISYLSPVLSRAVLSIFRMIAGEETARQLFQSNSGYVAPLLERMAGLGSVLLCLLGLPFGLRIVWRRYLNKVSALALAGAALAYFGMLGLRFSVDAWETGNRASEFLYIGLSFVVALGSIELWQSRRVRGLWRMIVTASVAIIFMGGVIAGWPPHLRLSQPYRIAVNGSIVEPQGLAAAQWFRSFMGRGNIMGADISNAQLMLVHGEQHAYAGKWPDTEDILETAEMPDWQIQILQRWQIRFFVVDRRLIRRNNMAGLYFDQTGGGPIPSTKLYPAEIYGKFDKQPKANRIFDSGNIVIYDVSELSNAPLLR